MKVAVIWVNYGLYHLARVKALAQVCTLHAIELSSFQRLYKWRIQIREKHFHHQLLNEGAWEDQSQWKIACRLFVALQRCSPQAVLIPGYSDLPSLTAALWGRMRRRVTVLMNETTSEDYPRKAWKELLKRLILRLLFDKATVGGKRSAKYVRSLGMKPHSIGFFYDTVDNEYFRQGTLELRTENKRALFNLPERYFLFVGRLASEKNIFSLLRAYRGFVEGGGTWGLVIVGDGPLAMEVRQFAKSLRLGENVVFTGFKNDRDILPYYAYATCFVISSTREPWGLVVNEAMASGLPVLVSGTCGCVDDLIEVGKNGFVFDFLNNMDLQALMLRMQALDDESRGRMGIRSSEIIGQYSPDHWATEISHILTDVR